MDAPDELINAVADAAHASYIPWRLKPLADSKQSVRYAWLEVADAVLAVPAIADALRAAETLAKARVEFADTPNTRYLGAQVAAMLRDGGE